MDVHGHGAGAGQVPMAAAPPGAVVVPVAVAAPQPAAGAGAPLPVPEPMPNWVMLSLRWAQALVVLGFAAAALAMFAINSTPAAGACAPTAEEAAALRAKAEDLLMAAAAQVLGATAAVLLHECVCPCDLFTLFATMLGWLTGYTAGDVLYLLVACHGHVHGDRLVYYCFFAAMFFVAFAIGFRASLRGLCCF